MGLAQKASPVLADGKIVCRHRWRKLLHRQAARRSRRDPEPRGVAEQHEQLLRLGRHCGAGSRQRRHLPRANLLRLERCDLRDRIEATDVSLRDGDGRTRDHRQWRRQRTSRSRPPSSVSSRARTSSFAHGRSTVPVASSVKRRRPGRSRGSKARSPTVRSRSRTSRSGRPGSSKPRLAA